MKDLKRSAFSIFELSISLLVISIITTTVIGGNKLIALSNIAKARTLTNSAPINSMKDLSLWLEATSKSSFNSTPVNGTTISTWKDINPQANFKKDATAGNSPTYVTNTINGLPAIRFNGSSNYLSSATDVNYTINPNMTIFVVYIFYSGGGTIQAFFGQDDGGWDRFILPQYLTVGIAGISNGSNLSNANNISKTNFPQIISAVLKNGVTNGSVVYINGVSNLVFTENHNNTGTTSIGVGAISPTGLYPAKIDLGELIIFNRALTDSERTEVESYLSRKWGIKLS